MIDQGVISGGMIPKVEACVRSVKAGVRKTHVIDGRVPHAMLLEFYTPQGIGTQMSSRTTEKTMKTEDIIKGEAQYILQTYGRPEFVLERAMGSISSIRTANRYLDFVSGLAVNALGYGDYEVLKAIEGQAAKLMHVSNIYHTIPSVEVAKRLVEHSFPTGCFSAQRHRGVGGVAQVLPQVGQHHPRLAQNRLIAFENSFHGRTYGSISTTGQPKYHKGFEPLLPALTSPNSTIWPP